MDYKNINCPVCGKPFAEGDDVVVCPVCATPQHRECWMVNGRCVNDDLHQSGYVWKRENEPAPEAPVEESTGSSKACHICGSENPADALHCGNCGALFGEQQKENKKCAFCGKENSEDARHCNQCGAPLGVFGGARYVAGTDIPADEKIGEIPAGELATYVQASAHRYIRNFKRFEEGKKLSFNFAAFFFAPYWFFYRKLYKAGAFFLVAFVTVSILLSGMTGQISAAAEEYSGKIASLGGEATTLTDEQLAAIEPEIEKYVTEFYSKVSKPLAITTAVTVILRLICALMANRLYYKKILEDMRLIGETVQDTQMKQLMVARKGGLSALAFTASVLGETMLVNALYVIADFIKGII